MNKKVFSLTAQQLNSLKAIKPWLPVLLWSAIIFFFSSNPNPYRYLPASWRSVVPLPTLTNSSAAELLGQLMHFLEYAVLAFLLVRALNITFPPTRSNSSNLKGKFKFLFSTPQHLNTLITVLLSMIFALSDEIHQIFVPGRAFQGIDLFIDLLGSLFGVYLYTKLKIEPQRHEEEKKEKTQRFLS